MAQRKITQLFHITRDEHADNLIKQIIRWVQRLYKFIELHIQALQTDPTGFRTVIVSVEIVNKELAHLHAFFRGAVVKLYWMQSREIFDPAYTLDKDAMRQAVKEIKEGARFFLYDANGNIEKAENGEPLLNTFAVFTETKAFSDRLKVIEQAVFEDNGYYFPNTEHWKANLKKHGESIANEYEVNMMLEYYRDRLHGGKLPTDTI